MIPLHRLLDVLTITVDYQHFNNPAYNADRGPVNVWGVRFHEEF